MPVPWVRRLTFGFSHTLSMSTLTLYSPMPDHPTDADPQPTNTPRRFLERTKATGRLVFHHVVKHTGVGIVCSVAYFDP
jgi:hypothetical protein